ncbi:ribosome small subunit-dependent GTPase A [Acidobacteriota bacterium]
MKLKELGFSDWFQERAKESQQSEFSLARVVAAYKDTFTVRNEETEIPAEVTGKLLYGAESNLDLPTVGDWVYVQYFNENTFAIIQEIIPRKSLLKRKAAGKKIEYQPIASNIDIAFVIQSLDHDFNLSRIERYLTMVNETHIKPVILLSKRDLISSDDLEQMISEIKNRDPDSDIIAFSNQTGEALDDIQGMLKKGQTYCLLGSSGVGKTTLINRLIGDDVFATAAVREKDSKGRHVTSHRQLIILEQGGMIIDTPGMRELGNIGVQTGLNITFSDVFSLAQDCRFKDCTHVNEPGCAVVKAVESGDLSAQRYQNYLKLRKESAYLEMSYLEKRNRDKKFGKMVKSVKKNMKKEKG